MKYFILKVALLVFVVQFYSCDSFLDVYDEGSSNLNADVKTVEDYQKILNHIKFSEVDYLIADMMSDDILLMDNSVQFSNHPHYINAYLWKKEFYDDNNQDHTYRNAYDRISNYNIILDGVKNSEVGDENLREQVKAEALIQRAWEYFQLVNVYGKSYDEKDSKKDLGIPLVLTPYDKLLSRATVSEVYSQILSDIEYAISIEELPAFGKDILHPGKASAYALLSRVYLYMGKFEESANIADKALSLKNSILDYNEYLKNSNSIFRELKDMSISSDDILFQKNFLNIDFYTYNSNNFPYLSNSLVQLLGPNDLRLQLSTTKNDIFYSINGVGGGYKLGLDYGINVTEMYLNKAEYLARNNRHQEAVDILNKIRIKRLPMDTYQPLNASNLNNSLSLVLDERRRELFMHGGIRLFDLKRYIKQGIFNEKIVRNSTTDNSIMAELESNSNRYIAPIAYSLILANPNIVQNDR